MNHKQYTLNNKQVILINQTTQYATKNTQSAMNKHKQPTIYNTHYSIHNTQ